MGLIFVSLLLFAKFTARFEKDRGDDNMYNVKDIAKYIISYSYEQNKPVSNLKLQKLLYFVQGESYKMTGEPMFEADMEAWQFGPVVPWVYYEYSNYAAMPILENYDINIEEETRVIIETVIKRHENNSVWSLVRMTHENGSPWEKTYVDYEKRVIDKQLIREAFANDVN
ncbi:Panacea domain-containing protein [Phascolarctobacterium faecium]|uniref:Panacea domain-containing protein n=1 Tax=Phascolarctobacterium faecium TaxID=33025 RepID=UPI003FD893C0